MAACTPETTTVTDKGTEQKMSDTETFSKNILGSWEVQSVNKDSDGTNIITFSTDGSVKSSLNNDSGKWDISENEGKLYLNIKSPNNDDETSEIKKLDATTLIIINRGTEITLSKK